MTISIEARRRLVLATGTAVVLAGLGVGALIINSKSSAGAASVAATVAQDKYQLLMHRAGEYAEDRPAEDNARYYEDGLIEAGPYAGYHRLIVEMPGVEADGPDYFTIATPDYRSFVIDKARSGAVVDPNQFNTRKVVAAVDLPKALPKGLALDNGFSLQFRGDFLAGKEAGEIALASGAGGLTFAATPLSADLDVWKTWLASDTTIRVRDAAGNSFRYHLALPAIAPAADVRLYGAYGNLLGEQCGDNGRDGADSFVVNGLDPKALTDLNLKSGGVALYAFADPLNQPLVTALYQLRQADSAERGKDNPLPALADYVKRAPILLFQDPWKRWVALGEHDYVAPGGCGTAGVNTYEG